MDNKILEIETKWKDRMRKAMINMDKNCGESILMGGESKLMGDVLERIGNTGLFGNET